MRPPVNASKTGDEIKGVCRATPLSRAAAASTSAAVGNCLVTSGAAMPAG
jgi:hypothetical protein